MSKYAEGTDVTVSKSQQDVVRLIKQRGVTQHSIGETAEGARLMFELQGLKFRFDVPYPDPTDRKFTRNANGWKKTATQIKARIEAETRRRWRVLLMRLKMKFETIDSADVSISEEFLAHIMLPTGGTVGDFVEPQINHIYETGAMPTALPGLGSNMLPANCTEAEVVR